jgi:hypothetical protein
MVHTSGTVVRTYVRTYEHPRDRLTTVLGRVSGTSATVEPRVLQPQDGADQRRGDIKVSKHGNTWILGVGPWNLQARTTTETGLREAMQALVRVQAHMLARIVMEIRAADIAVELEL